MWYSSVTIWLWVLADKCYCHGVLVQVTRRSRAQYHWRSDGLEPTSQSGAACEGQAPGSSPQSWQGTDVFTVLRQRTWQIEGCEDLMVMEGGMGMSESCWRVQGLGRGRWLPLPSGPALDHLCWLPAWPGSFYVAPQLGCGADEGAHSPIHVGCWELVSLYNVLSEEGKNWLQVQRNLDVSRQDLIWVTEEAAPCKGRSLWSEAERVCDAAPSSEAYSLWALGKYLQDKPLHLLQRVFMNWIH